MIQASLVDTWAATAAGAYTLTENTLYTVEAFNDYLDHLTDDGVLTITRWVFDGLRLVSLAQEACAARGWTPPTHLAIVRHDRVATFLLKKTPFTAGGDRAAARRSRDELGFDVLYAPGDRRAIRRRRRVTRRRCGRRGTQRGDYARLILAADREQFYDDVPLGHPADDRRPAVLLPHDASSRTSSTSRSGESMLFGNGLSALMTLLGISAALVVLFVDRAAAAGRRAARGRAAGSRGWRTSARSAPASC